MSSCSLQTWRGVLEHLNRLGHAADFVLAAGIGHVIHIFERVAAVADAFCKLGHDPLDPVYRTADGGTQQISDQKANGEKGAHGDLILQLRGLD